MPESSGLVADFRDVEAEELGRLRRLEALVQLSKLYRKFVAAELLLSNEQSFAVANRPDTAEGRSNGSAEDATEELLQRVEEIEEMQETAARLQTAFATVCGKLDLIYGADTDAKAKPVQPVEEALRTRVENDFQRLTVRAAACLAQLPYRTVGEARAAAEAEIERLRIEAAESGRLEPGIVARVGERVERLGKEAKRREAKLEEGLENIRERPLSSLREAASFSKNLWARLNGGGGGAKSGAAAVLDALPQPPPYRQEYESRTVSMALEVEEADRMLQEACKAREARLRKRDGAARTLLARDIGELDAAVRNARVVLAVRQLAMEMERAYAALGEEAREDAGSGPRNSLSRAGDDLGLFLAEFSALNASLARARMLVMRDQALLLSDEELDVLAADTRELTQRLGLGEDDGGSGLSIGMLAEKSARSVRDGAGKVREAAGFISRGVRLLGSDLGASMRIFMRAVTGSTLKPREVQSLRRTSKDVAMFVPFVIILIAPITPVGHVLVFSFFQQSGFFPSQFTARRQELARKFDELQERLQAAEATATEMTEAAALKRAQEVVSALTRGEAVETPRGLLGGPLEGDGETATRQLKEELKQAEEELMSNT